MSLFYYDDGCLPYPLFHEKESLQTRVSAGSGVLTCRATQCLETECLFHLPVHYLRPSSQSLVPVSRRPLIISGRLVITTDRFYLFCHLYNMCSRLVNKNVWAGKFLG